MDKEINVMMERKVWDLVDHPDNIKILENRWVYTIKYDENNKIVRYKARLVARGNTQLRNSDFATNRDDRVSMGGFITFIDETPISWRTFKQNPLVCRPWKLKMESNLVEDSLERQRVPRVIYRQTQLHLIPGFQVYYAYDIAPYRWNWEANYIVFIHGFYHYLD
ncbi:retrovirus-related Pol polyprotein from transposon RE1 [Trichonephila clavipes]|nr:retrovirus-related Pol polyprotein from transposon RE1 [Trichonephila clavipes]